MQHHRILTAILALVLATQAFGFEQTTAKLRLAADTTSGTTTDEASMTDHKLGPLILHAPFARATLPNQPVAGAFLSVTNTGTEDDVLVSVETAIAGRAEIHEMALTGDTMKMRHLPDGLVIPAGGTVDLKPGGFHLMLMDLHQPLIEGEPLEITLTFRDAGTVTLPFTIAPKGAKSLSKGHGT